LNMKKTDIKSLYYITHVNNLNSILKHGILAHDRIEEMKIQFTPIYDTDIVARRKDRLTPANKSLWQYANLYFQPRNPMMYRVVFEKGRRDLAVVAVNPATLNGPSRLVTDGNAASGATRFFSPEEGLDVVIRQWKAIQQEYWNEEDGSKRKIMAECLIPDSVAPEFIHSIYVADHESQQIVESLLPADAPPVVPEPYLFFQPTSKKQIGKNISLIDGDMFFSNMQTLTISVNLQGIMGKGLASRAKYQFPDVYVRYQDACRARSIMSAKPYLYKREASLDQQLADLDRPLVTANSVKWFLLFATKRKWREDSRLEDIELGVHWIRDNYQRENIRSLAMPALGCGLGKLSWSDVGSVICRYLHGIEIPVAIYLPREHKIDPQYLSEPYLLGG
jgi:hypothetical protein